MTISRTITSTAASLVVAATLAGSALAGGEAKNDRPFTAAATASTAATSSVAPRGEAKNGLPFSRRAAQAATVSGGGGGLGGLDVAGIAVLFVLAGGIACATWLRRAAPTPDTTPAA